MDELLLPTVLSPVLELFEGKKDVWLELSLPLLDTVLLPLLVSDVFPELVPKLTLTLPDCDPVLLFDPVVFEPILIVLLPELLLVLLLFITGNNGATLMLLVSNETGACGAPDALINEPGTFRFTEMGMEVLSPATTETGSLSVSV